MKKVEIIERITDANGSISENILTSWEHKKPIHTGNYKVWRIKNISTGTNC